MILTEVYVPALNQVYDFKLDENAYIADVVDELGTLVFLREGDTSEEQLKDLILCDYNRQRIFPLDQTLKQNGIGSGCRLALI